MQIIGVLKKFAKKVDTFILLKTVFFLEIVCLRFDPSEFRFEIRQIAIKLATKKKE